MPHKRDGDADPGRENESAAATTRTAARQLQRIEARCHVAADASQGNLSLLRNILSLFKIWCSLKLWPLLTLIFGLCINQPVQLRIFS